MKKFMLGVLLGAAVMHWSGHHSDTIVRSVTDWFWGAAGNYAGASDSSAGKRHR
jgi:hypothetical protein